MRGKFIGVIVAVLVIAGIVGVWYSSNHPLKEVQVNPKGAILAKMGSLTCYQYDENLTTIDGNVTDHTTIYGGYSNGSYFFHGKKENFEWWGLLEGKNLTEKILRNGSVSQVNLTLTDSEIKDLTLYDPIKTGLMALGSTSAVEVSKSWITANYTIYITYWGSGAIITGTIKVLYGKDYTPKRIEMTGKISRGNEILQEFSISALIVNSCELPEWAKELKG
ncbi:MAG: hypothetical protein J7L37_00400 [Thermococcus sp.]|nr:hypothetical protein [Thermococcus sp.]